MCSSLALSRCMLSNMNEQPQTKDEKARNIEMSMYMACRPVACGLRKKPVIATEKEKPATSAPNSISFWTFLTFCSLALSSSTCSFFSLLLPAAEVASASYNVLKTLRLVETTPLNQCK